MTEQMPVAISFDRARGILGLRNGRLSIEIATAEGLNPNALLDSDTGRIYADADYVWQGLDGSPRLAGEPVITHESDGSAIVKLIAVSGELEVTYSLRLPAGETNAAYENVVIRNLSGERKDTSAFACGFAKRIPEVGAGAEDTSRFRLCELPYRRHPETGELREVAIPEMVGKEYWYSTMRSPIYDRATTDTNGSEAWAWFGGDAAEENESTLLISKYNPDSLEWSLVKASLDDSSEALLRFGGAGMWKLGDPEGGASLDGGAAFAFGETRFSLLDGSWSQALTDYRTYTAAKGHRTPPAYDPPINWNELYDNEYWWHVVELDWNALPPERLEQHFQFADMVIEADKAREIGCDCFYLDPGWDVEFGSSVWDERRLGKQADFAKWLDTEYGMSLGLHVPLAPWSSIRAFPEHFRSMRADGSPTTSICVANVSYIELKVEQVKELCRNGASFLLYDGSWYEGPCCDPTHGHAVPSTRQNHLDALLAIATRVHEAYPDVVIEQHDPIIGPGTPRYAPTYFMHGKPGAFNELWGFEFMVEPLDDILSGRALSLYYLNMAYEIPVYLHIDLRKDNEHGLMFWWYASTLRHYGFGGKHADERIWNLHKEAVREYRALKRFFAQGTFWGLGETVHAHTLADVGEAVIGVFNLSEAPEVRVLTFKTGDIGLAGLNLQAEGASWSQDGDRLTLTVSLPARSHALVKLRSSSQGGFGTPENRRNELTI